LFASNAAGTSLVLDINPTTNSIPRNLANINGTLFFSADNGDGNGHQLWLTKII
jgi:hypothetical protein